MIVYHISLFAACNYLRYLVPDFSTLAIFYLPEKLSFFNPGFDDDPATQQHLLNVGAINVFLSTFDSIFIIKNATNIVCHIEYGDTL